MYGTITDIQRFSLNDGIGIRTTVFLKGCPLKCPWCHNPETKSMYPDIMFRAVKCIGCAKCRLICPIPDAVLLKGEDRINKKFCINCLKCTEICPSAALITTGRKVSVDEVIAEVMKDAPFYANSGGGITVSGGEPLAQADFTAALLKTARGQGLNTCIDTSGYAVKSAWDKVLPHLNIALYDIKIMDDEMHKKIIGVSNRIIIENLKRVAAEVEVRIRIPLIPGINDTEDFFEQLGNLAVGAGVKKCDIIPYHSYGNHKYQLLGKAEEIFHCGSVAAEKTEKFKQMLDDRGFEVTIGG